MNGKALRRRRVAAVLVAMVAGAGCGGDDRPPVAKVDPDDPDAACKVVTVDDMRAVANVPPADNEIVSGRWLGNPPIRNLPGVTYCLWGDELGTLNVYVGLSTFEPDATAYARRVFERWRGGGTTTTTTAAKSPAAVQRVKGLGDEAAWAGSTDTGNLVVLAGGRILTITIGGRQAPGLERAKKLAARALRRI